MCIPVKEFRVRQVIQYPRMQAMSSRNRDDLLFLQVQTGEVPRDSDCLNMPKYSLCRGPSQSCHDEASAR